MTAPTQPSAALTRPWFDYVRARLGYRLPRFGPLCFKAFFALVARRNLVEIFPGILIEMDFADLTHRATYWQGKRFERPTPEVLGAWAAHPKCRAFFDIGANYGFYSYQMLASSPHAVYAFDPHPANYQQLLDAKTRNALRNFYPQHMGLSDEEGRLTLFHGDVDRGHTTFLAHAQLQSARQSTSPVMAFDDWVRRHYQGDVPEGEPVWMAKIDVEGYELKVLHGMREALSQRRFLGLAVEINTYTLGLANTRTDEIFTYLARCGYRPTDAGARPGGGSSPQPNAFFVPD